MITCPKCNKELSDGTKFCDDCGTPIFETIFCPNCGQKTSSEAVFCPNCGTSIAEKPKNQSAITSARKKRNSKKAIVIGGGSIAIIAVLIFVISCFFNGKGKAGTDYILYLKDKEIFANNLKKDSDSWQLTSRLADTENVDNKALADEAYMLGYCTYISQDGKYIFFPDKADDEGFNLYYKAIAKSDDEAIKIESDVQWYVVNSTSDIITYLKGDEGNLYQYKIDEGSKEKIASKVSDFRVSDDGNKIIYITYEENIYIKYADREKEKIVSECTSVEQITEDLTTVYYIKDDSLYKQVEGQDKIKIASNIYRIINIYDSGEIYYLTQKEEQKNLMDYVVDDMKDIDAAITEFPSRSYPAGPNRPSWWDYGNDEEYDAAYAIYEQEHAAYEEECNRVDAEYEAACEAYWAKEYRDELRRSLEEENLIQTTYSLCFYNGTEEITVTDDFYENYLMLTNFSRCFYASDTPVISYEVYNQDSFEKVKLSEVEDIYDFKDMIENTIYSSTDIYIAVKEKATIVEQEKAECFRINHSGTAVYYIDNVSEGKDYGELYRISISGEVVGKAEEYDSDVQEQSPFFASDSELVYLKNCDDWKGELYINKEKISDDVEMGYSEAYSELGKVFYFTDWNDDKEYGTLNFYNGKESVKIADDVHSYYVTQDGRVLYLYDYSLKYYTGELYEWFDDETRKIDDDVVCVLSIFNNKNGGYTIYDR